MSETMRTIDEKIAMHKKHYDRALKMFNMHSELAERNWKKHVYHAKSIEKLMVKHIIDEIHEITQEEIDIIHLEIHRITDRDKEGIEGQEMTNKERTKHNEIKREINKTEVR